MSICQIAKVVKRPGASLAHSHGSVELILATGGEGAIVAVGHGEFAFRTGTLMVVPQGVVHYNYSDAPYRQTALRFDTPRQIARTPITIEDVDSSFLALFNAIFNAFYTSSPVREPLLASLEDALITLLCGAMQSDGTRCAEVEELISVINNEYLDPEFTVGDAAKAVAYSEAHLRKLFRREVGMTMSQYLNKLRLEHAARILKTDTCSISVTAELSGFGDFRYFSRLFKSHYGITPHAWRVKHRKNG